MAKAKVVSTAGSSQKVRPALTPENRELQLISLAVDLAEQQLRDGTASSQVIAHFLKQSTEKSRLEREKLENENALLRAKTEALESSKRIEALYEDAIKAMRNYAGYGNDDGDQDGY